MERKEMKPHFISQEMKPQRENGTLNGSYELYLV